MSTSKFEDMLAAMVVEPRRIEDVPAFRDQVLEKAQERYLDVGRCPAVAFLVRENQVMMMDFQTLREELGTMSYSLLRHLAGALEARAVVVVMEAWFAIAKREGKGPATEEELKRVMREHRSIRDVPGRVTVLAVVMRERHAEAQVRGVVVHDFDSEGLAVRFEPIEEWAGRKSGHPMPSPLEGFRSQLEPWWD